MRSFYKPVRWRFLAVFLIAITALATFFIVLPGSAAENPTPVPPQRPASTSVAFKDPTAAAAIASAQSSLDALLARQSTTLAEAVAKYTLKAGRPPPPNYDRWFDFAQENGCLVDDYDQIQKDFEPFYQLAVDRPKHFQSMIDQRRSALVQETLGLSPKRQAVIGMTAIAIKAGRMKLPPYRGTYYYNELPMRLRRFQDFLPDLEFLLNGRDEPRVVFDARKPDAREDALSQPKDAHPFHVRPNKTDVFFQHQSGCAFLSTDGFGSDISADVPFLRSSSSSDFTTDLWPLLSMAKLSPCFSDILFPGQYYYASRWSPRLKPNDILWRDKKTQLYWRGASNGGHIIGTNYRSFPRFRLIELAREFPELIDAKITQFTEGHCTDACDRDSIIKEYNITGPRAPRDDVLHYKYLLDVDGNTFSGRFLTLMRSGSLVFKSTVFVEYFNDWLRPYEHYIPVKPDLSDLVDKIRWAMDHEAEARIILERGKLFAERVVTDAQNDCYFSAVLLEWARVQNHGKGEEP